MVSYSGGGVECLVPNLDPSVYTPTYKCLVAWKTEELLPVLRQCSRALDVLSCLCLSAMLTRRVCVSDPEAVVETHSTVPYAVTGGILAFLVFTIICVLIVTIWCSVRQKGSYLTHEASGLDEHGEVQEAFLNGSDSREGKKEYLL
ncbi:hypothetical protein JZ751_007428 [Albula glossodonta]|uniref:Neurexin/syndecan/glycophorin C domain-containing protein n=1 Tax=Albula glossodonta TaxID=121402 RepID=A0A8T2N3V8_9TELE|nr:hypothetical protein JZ751_007428 [Albula glossodonta]